MSDNTDETIKKASGISSPELLLYIFFASGICTLIYGIVWFRLLKLTFGNAAYTSGIIVIILLSGVSLGSLIMKRYADIVSKRLRLYAVLEFLTAISALSVPLLLKLVDGVYKQFFAQVNPSSPALFMAKLIAALILLLIPAVLTGSTFPLIGRCVTGVQHTYGQSAGRVYASKMLGAALGSFLAGFVLIRSAGIMGTLYIAVVLNVLVAIAAWMLSRAHEIPGEAVEKPDDSHSSWRLLILILTVIYGGLISAAYLHVWVRSMVTLAGGSVFMVLAILTVYLVGNGLGIMIGSGVSERTRQPAVVFGIALACLGISGVFYINWLDIFYSGLVFKIAGATTDFWQTTPNRIILYPLFINSVIFLIPAVISGIMFPFALQAWGKYRQNAGKITGMVFSANTIGAALGVFIAVFLLIPLSGVQSSMILLGLPGIWLGSILIFIFLVRGRIILKISSLAIAACFTVAVFLLPSGRFIQYFTNIHKQGSKVVAVREGVNTDVSVHRNIRNEQILVKSGMQVASNGRDFRISQKISGHLGYLLNRNTKRVLVAGFGSGEAAACIITHGAQTVDIAEISPELVDISLKYFSSVNSGKQLFDKNADIIYMDPKNYLHLTRNDYDLIIADAISSANNSSGSFCTKEFFQSALNRLNDGGIFGCRLPLRELPVSSVNSILGTFNEVFPHITVWMPLTAPSGYDFLFLAGSREKQMFSPAYINSELSKDDVMNNAGYINFSDSHSVLSCYICDKKGLDSLIHEFEMNTDINPFVEFNTDITGQVFIEKQWLAEFLKIARQDNLMEKIDPRDMTVEEQQEWNRQNRLYYGVSNILLNARIESDLFSVLENCYIGLSILPANLSVIEQEKYTLDKIHNLIISNPEYAEFVLKKANIVLQQMPRYGNMWLLSSWAYFSRKDIKQALVAAENAAGYYPGSPEIQFNLGSLLMETRQLNKSIIHLKESIKLEPGNLAYHNKLWNVYFLNNQYDEALSEILLITEADPYNYKAYYSLGEFYSMMGRQAEAAGAYRKSLKINPDFEMASGKPELIPQQ